MPQIRIIKVQRSMRIEFGERRIILDAGCAEVCASVSSGPGRNTEGTIRCREVPHAPQCSSTTALQLNCILRRDKHIIRSSCKRRPITIDEYKDLGQM